MLSLLRSNQPIAWLILPMTAALLWFLDFSFDTPFVENSTASSLIAHTFSLRLPLWTHWPLIFLNAALVNYLLSLHELQPQRNNFAGWLMLVLFWLVSPSASASIVLLAMPFFTLGLTILLGVYRQNDAGAAYFNAAFLASVGSLFLTYGSISLLLILLSLLYTRTPNWREITLLILGAAFPPLLFLAISFLLDSEVVFHSLDIAASQLPGLTLLLVVSIGALTIVGLLKLLGTFSTSSNKSKNSKAVLMINAGGLIVCAALLYPSSPLGALYLSFLPAVLFIQAIFTAQKKFLWHDLLFAAFMAFAIWYWATVVNGSMTIPQ